MMVTQSFGAHFCFCVLACSVTQVFLMTKPATAGGLMHTLLIGATFAFLVQRYSSSANREKSFLTFATICT